MVKKNKFNSPQHTEIIMKRKYLKKNRVTSQIHHI